MTNPTAIKMVKVEFFDGPWKQRHPLNTIAMKYSNTGDGRIEVTTQKGDVEKYDIKGNSAGQKLEFHM